MSERRARYVVEVVPDSTSSARTKQAIKSINDEFAKVGRTRAFDNLTKDANRAAAATGNVADEVRRAQREVDRFNTDFDAISRDVGLAGDVQSNLGAISALTGSQEIAVAGEVAALVEELPRLKAAVAGLPATLASAASAIGGPGLGLIGATAALIIVLKLAQEEFNRTKEAAGGVLDAQREALELARSGTQEEINAERERRELALEAARIERDRLAELERNFTQALDASGLRVAAELGNAIGVGDGSLAALRDRLNEANNEIASSEQALGILDQALGDNATQARLAADANRELAAALQEQLDTDILDRLQLRNQFEGQSADAIEDAIESRRRETALIFEALKNTNLSADAADGLRGRLSELSDEVVTLEQALLPAARAAEEAAAALADEKRQRDETIAATRRFNEGFKQIQDTATQDRLKIEQDYADDIVNLAEEYTADVEQANRELADSLSDLVTDLARDAADAERQAQANRLEDQIEFNQETAKQSRDLQRELRQIREDSAAQEAELIRGRDFAGLQRLRGERNRAVDDAVDTFNAEQREREIAFRQQQEQTNRELQFEAEARRIDFEQRVADARAAYARERADLERNRREQEQRLRQSRNRELQIVSETQSSKLRLLAQSYNQELQLAAQTAQQRVAIQRQSDAALLAQANLARGAFGLAGAGNQASFANTFNISSGATAAQTVGTGIAIANEVRWQLQQIFG